MSKGISNAALTILLTVAAVAVAPVGVDAGAGEIPALRRANTFFNGNGGVWDNWIVGPLARRQATRKLARLSGSLSALANEKQELLEALSASGGKFDRQRAKVSIANFKDIVQQLRRDMQDFSEILPEEERAEGNRIAEDLFEGLSLKWQTLNRAEELVSDDSARNSEQVVKELRQGVSQVLELKRKVDNLVTYINTH